MLLCVKQDEAPGSTRLGSFGAHGQIQTTNSFAHLKNSHGSRDTETLACAPLKPRNGMFNLSPWETPQD